MGAIRLDGRYAGGRSAGMVVPRAHLVLVHRRTQHRDRRDPAHISGQRNLSRPQGLRVPGAGRAMSSQPDIATGEERAAPDAVSDYAGVNRLPAPMGLLIDRSRSVTFSFEGQ